MKLDATNIEEYFDQVPDDRKEALQQVRELIITHAPDVTEIFKYNLPFYPIQDKPFISLASQKHYMSFYLNEPELIKEFKERLGKVDVAKNCIRFKDFEKVNKKEFVNLIKRAFRKRVSELS